MNHFGLIHHHWVWSCCGYETALRSFVEPSQLFESKISTTKDPFRIVGEWQCLVRQEHRGDFTYTTDDESDRPWHNPKDVPPKKSIAQAEIEALRCLRVDVSEHQRLGIPLTYLSKDPRDHEDCELERERRQANEYTEGK